MIYYCSRRYLTVTFARFIVCQTSAQTLPSVSAPINIQLRSKSTVSKMYLLTSRRHYRIRTKLQQLLISTWTNRRVIAMMLVRPSVSVCLSVWDRRALWSYGTLTAIYGSIVQCYAHPDTKACPTMSTYFRPSISTSTWKRGGVWMCKLGVVSQEWFNIEVKLLLSANRKSYMPRRLAQQRMTLSDLECPHLCGSWASRLVTTHTPTCQVTEIISMSNASSLIEYGAVLVTLLYLECLSTKSTRPTMKNWNLRHNSLLKNAFRWGIKGRKSLAGQRKCY